MKSLYNWSCPYCHSIRIQHCYSYVETAYDSKCADCEKYFNHKKEIEK